MSSTLFADAIFNTSGTYNRSRGEKLAANAPMIVTQTVIGGLYTWGAVACFSAGGGWIILGCFCVMGVVGALYIVGDRLVAALT